MVKQNSYMFVLAEIPISHGNQWEKYTATDNIWFNADKEVGCIDLFGRKLHSFSFL